ncbi:MAG: chromosomal replication initiator protein DnaA [Planctomycetaceae bacterium]
MTQPSHHGQSPRELPENDASRIDSMIRDCIGEQNFRHWFSGRLRFEVADNMLLIYAPNPFTSNWLMKRFRRQLNHAASQLLGPSASFEIVVDPKLKDQSVPGQIPCGSETAKSNGHDDPPSSCRGQGSAASEERCLPNAPEPQRSSPRNGTPSASGPQPLSVPARGRRRFQSLTTFVPGQCNELALLAARQVVQAPGERFNPLYVHGSTGVGKTHLLEGIYSEIRRTKPNLRMIYLTSEGFTNYFMQALAARTVPSFRQRFRDVDVLLIDNIEFLDSKKATQEEFLHTIVQVIDHGGQLVVSGDRHPRLLTKHREELTTRFMSGLVCRIEAPCEDTRRNMTRSLALPMTGSFTQEALDFVARRCQKNVREIQGALNCLHSHFELTGRKITVARAREILGDMERECRRLVRINDVEKVICDAFGLTAADLRSKSRRRAVACPRSLAMYIARKLTKLAYREIGAYFGGRDHSTVVAAEKRVLAWVESDEAVNLPSSCRGRSVAEIIAELEERLMALAC